MNTEFIQLKEVSKKFRGNVVLDKVNLSVPEKQITGIIGASGEGKSTILKLLIGFYKPSGGEVLYLKRNIKKEFSEIRRKFGFATEDGSFYNGLTVKENIYHFGRLHKVSGSDIRDRAERIMKMMDLANSEKTLARNLSVGMKKRLDVACALIHNPKVLIMDEPTADLDPLLRAQMLLIIKKISKRGTTVILTTQLLDEMDKVCDKIAILYDKNIVEEGTPNEMRRKYKAKDLNSVFEKIFSGRLAKNVGKGTNIDSKKKISKVEIDSKKRKENYFSKIRKFTFLKKDEVKEGKE